jgi:hypothetical protein
MATSEILGLFASPEQYQANQMAQFRQQAASEVQSNPFQQAAINMRQAGYQLGGGIAGALGGQDPQLQKITQRQQLLGMIDPANPDSYGQAIQAALQVGDQEAAFLLRNEMMKVKEQAQTQQLNELKTQDYLTQRGLGMQERGLANLANELAGQLQNADGTINNDALARLQSFPQGRAVLKALVPETMTVKEGETIVQKPTLPNQPFKTLLAGAPKPIPFTGDESNAALFLYQTNDPVKIFEKHGQAGLDAVDKRAKAVAGLKSPKIEVNMSDPTAVAKANLDVMGKWEGFLKSGGDVEVASRFKALQSSVALAQGGNPTADGATIFNIGKIYDPSGAVQEGDKNTILGNPSIPQKIKGYAQRVFEGGSLTPEQRNDLLAIGTNLIKGRESQLQTYRKQYINKAKTLGGTEEDILNPYQGLIKATPSESVNQIPTGRQQPQPAARTQPKPQGKSVIKWSDLTK